MLPNLKIQEKLLMKQYRKLELCKKKPLYPYDVKKKNLMSITSRLNDKKQFKDINNKIDYFYEKVTEQKTPGWRNHFRYNSCKMLHPPSDTKSIGKLKGSSSTNNMDPVNVNKYKKEMILRNYLGKTISSENKKGLKKLVLEKDIKELLYGKIFKKQTKSINRTFIKQKTMKSNLEYNDNENNDFVDDGKIISTEEREKKIFDENMKKLKLKEIISNSDKVKSNLNTWKFISKNPVANNTYYTGSFRFPLLCINDIIK